MKDGRIAITGATSYTGTALSHHVVTRRVAEGRLWHGSLRYCAVLSYRTVPDRGS
jgi:hypothetical protein